MTIEPRILGIRSNFGRERGGWETRDGTAVLRQNAALKCGLAAPTGAAICDGRKPMTTLTYIFIGILTILIYPDDHCGVDHNMLSIDRAWATPKSAVSELVRAFCGRL